MKIKEELADIRRRLGPFQHVTSQPFTMNDAAIARCLCDLVDLVDLLVDELLVEDEDVHQRLEERVADDYSDDAGRERVDRLLSSFGKK